MPRQIIELEITRKISIEIDTDYPLNESEVLELGSGLCHTIGEDATNMLEDMDREGDVINLTCHEADVKIIKSI